MPLLSTFGAASSKAFGQTRGVKKPYTVAFLLVAGGAGGAVTGASGGGGGAGGYRNSYSTEPSGANSSTLTPYIFTPGETYTITVGGGGIGLAANLTGNNGSPSSISGPDISTTSATGGGGGGRSDPNPAKSGGCGGGNGGPQTSRTGAGTANQGFAGGLSNNGGWGGGGGGGAGQIGQDTGGSGTSGVTGGDGGDGIQSSITGIATYRGGGGGGNDYQGPNVGIGGLGGGGNGGSGPGGQQPGTANTGGGGGGGRVGSATNGGSGVVILRMPTKDYTGTTTGSPTVGAAGTDTVLTFTGSGSYTA